jgi:hypothetical protein
LEWIRATYGNLLAEGAKSIVKPWHKILKIMRKYRKRDLKLSEMIRLKKVAKKIERLNLKQK